MYIINHLLCPFLLLQVIRHTSATESETTKLLIPGGNGMLGSAAVRSLLDVDDGVRYDITILNRGNWYWDTEKIIKPYVKHIQCTRGKGFRESCTQLHNATFDTIIDFSSVNAMDLANILVLLNGNFKRYIYISSSAIYEVVKPKTREGYWKEEDAVRPEDEVMESELNKKLPYGHAKLTCEEVLQAFHVKFDYEFISLRLPFALGPRDNSHRFYKYFIWAKLHEVIGPVHIPKASQDWPIGFVYSLDVGPLIAGLANPSVNSSTFNHAYNIAFEEAITIKDLVMFISDWLHQNGTQFDESEGAHIIFDFPPVTPMDIGKAKAILKWSPSHINKALDEICKFYEIAQHSTEYKHILDTVLKELGVSDDKYRDFMDVHHTGLKREL